MIEGKGRLRGMAMRTAAVLCGVLLTAGATALPPENEASEKAAQAAAESWLALVDADQYAESWERAATLFQQQVTVEQWEKAIRSVHAQTGKFVSRKLKSAQYTKVLPGAPEGEYVILQFDSAFEKAKPVTETVVPMKDKDGAWRVSGYFVK